VDPAIENGMADMDLSATNIGTVSAKDPIIQPYMVDPRAEKSYLGQPKPFVMGHSKMSIRRSRSVCPVPLSRPSTRDTQRNHQGGEAVDP